MSFTFSWTTFGAPTGITTLNDNGQTSVLTVVSDPAVFYSPFDDGSLFVSSVSLPTTSSIAFTNPIKNFSFQILDLDSNEVTFDDKVTILALNKMV